MAAVVSFPPDLDLDGVRDSKTLSFEAREELYGRITGSCLGFGTGRVGPEEIDRFGMAEAVRLSFVRAAYSLGISTDLFIIDGLPVSGLGIPARFVIRGDSRSMSVAAAGIVAKVTRDRMMLKADALYPGYGFSTNMGYGTPEHISALKRLGPCHIHRRSFAPLRHRDQLELPFE